MQITEQTILQLAPNPQAVENGRKLSQKGSFSAQSRTEDGMLYWAQCIGSGKNPYHTSIDWTNADGAPTCRCSCPSRQFPCKHAIGLMFEMLAGKMFAIAEVPEDLAKKREKQAARAAKKEDKQLDKTRKNASSAQKKKIEKQIEGLALAEKMVDDLLTAGVDTLAGASAQAYEKLAKELGNHYLAGPQTAFARMALAVKRIQADPTQANSGYAEALRTLIALHATIKKSREFLSRKLEVGDYAAEDSVLFEALGGVWRLEELKSVGECRENVRLAQLSFDVSFDVAKRERVERGFWLDLDRCDIVQTLNYRPVKAIKHIKEEDSCLGVVDVPLLCVYPGDLNRRVRWESCTARPLTEEEGQRIPMLAKAGIAEVTKTAKGQMKNTLLPKYIPALLPIGEIGWVGEQLVLADPAGNRIALRDREEEGKSRATTARLAALPFTISAGSALFGLMFYDETDRRICVHPYSVATSEGVVRLLY